MDLTALISIRSVALTTTATSGSDGLYPRFSGPPTNSWTCPSRYQHRRQTVTTAEHPSISSTLQYGQPLGIRAAVATLRQAPEAALHRNSAVSVDLSLITQRSLANMSCVSMIDDEKSSKLGPTGRSCMSVSSSLLGYTSPEKPADKT